MAQNLKTTIAHSPIFSSHTHPVFKWRLKCANISTIKAVWVHKRYHNENIKRNKTSKIISSDSRFVIENAKKIIKLQNIVCELLRKQFFPDSLPLGRLYYHIPLLSTAADMNAKEYL
uniref:Uncharacterized protein n=1 Tax=Glossina austeni TaxID=7395 RepID=A0A1A9VC39_GLOAU